MQARMDALPWFLTSLMAIVAQVLAFEEMPKFHQMELLYPGYSHHGGSVHNRDIASLIGSNRSDVLGGLRNTAPLRLSYMLNRYGGRHAIGTAPVLLSKRGRDSVTGRDGQEYIYRNTAFGPFLAAKYGNPMVVRPPKMNRGGAGRTETMRAFRGKQGIVRLVSYHRTHAGGHVGLWDCDHFYHSDDWSAEHSLISVEFWEASDSYCPPNAPPTPVPRMQPLAPGTGHVIARHNTGELPLVITDSTKQQRHLRHHRAHTRATRRLQQRKETLWLQ